MIVTVRLDHPSTFHGRESGLNVAIVFSHVPFDRQLAALRAITQERLPLHWLILDVLLGCTDKLAGHNRVKKTPASLVPPTESGFPALNESQTHAVTVALKQRLTTIQGPPGTGKTTVIAALAHSFVKSGIKPVLVCALSNVATDFVTTKLAEAGLNVSRVLSHAREGIAGEVEIHTTRAKAAERFGQDPATDWDKADPSARRASVERERLIAGESDVVCATCVSAGGARLRDIVFKVVIFDESGQCLDPDLLIALTHGADQAIFVGDHKQLRPLVMSREAGKARYDMPLIERLVLLGLRPSVLRQQYRMHPAISEFPSEAFYGKLISDGITEEDRVWGTSTIPWPRPDWPLMFWNVDSKEEYYESASSFMNSSEAGYVAQLLSAFKDAGVDGWDIGIITPYAGQQSHLIEALPGLCGLSREDPFFEELEIASVDSFQGREKNFIIFSTVRANTDHVIGFLKDLKRMCVSLTRAKYGLVIVGNALTFARSKIWTKLIEHCTKKGVFMEGETLDTLVPSTFTSLVAEGDYADEDVDYNADLEEVD
jgi:regulator of nonsense transcripts 1